MNVILSYSLFSSYILTCMCIHINLHVQLHDFKTLTVLVYAVFLLKMGCIFFLFFKKNVVLLVLILIQMRCFFLTKGD